MSKRDYYEVLGVGRDANESELKKAYRKKAMQYHPDRNPDNKEAESNFKELNESYEILKNDQKRAAYDRYGHAAFEQASGGGGGFGGFGGGGFSDIFEDMFGDLMGGGARRGSSRRNMRGADLRYDMGISLEDAFNGFETVINVPTSVVCEDCKGTGTAGGKEPETCPTCRGMGKVRIQQGFFTIERTCHTCHGTGKVIKDPCHTCHGKGSVPSGA